MHLKTAFLYKLFLTIGPKTGIIFVGRMSVQVFSHQTFTTEKSFTSMPFTLHFPIGISRMNSRLVFKERRFTTTAFTTIATNEWFRMA